MILDAIRHDHESHVEYEEFMQWVHRQTLSVFGMVAYLHLAPGACGWEVGGPQDCIRDGGEQPRLVSLAEDREISGSTRPQGGP